MPLTLQEIDPETGFPSLAKCMFEMYEDPLQKRFRIYFPIHGTGPEAREAAAQEGAARLKTWWAEDPTISWYKVVTGIIAGAATWNTYLETPSLNQSHQTPTGSQTIAHKHMLSKLCRGSTPPPGSTCSIAPSM
ncbi:hypothetical protein HIM_04189 [Hirsutella minnesotensis 3608]|uniref:Uncharacterized protein n=1 Tax=Hirsutella minnesotensis 3608 TaxID=1043627 RepID=A0A0F7ZQ15_9HYPO|nr:hypothetical protein HIM_04189 [Hirsutella minnesotensis 3608]